MALLARYYVPGLAVEDRSINVPLDWRGNRPGEGFEGPSLSLFYRIVAAPERVHDDMPLLVFLQGGPGGAGPRPLNPSSDGWMAEAIKHFRVILPDQRGTGRSSCVDSNVMRRLEPQGAQTQADYLKRFLAGSIVRDFEHLRRTEFGGRRWVTLGQSYGGFLTLSYLSLFPQGVAASFTTGGIPHVPADATEVYEHTFPRMVTKTEQYYQRYPLDAQRVAIIADKLSEVADFRDSDSVCVTAAKSTFNGIPALPNGDLLTVERLQTLGGNFGMKPSFERLHWIVDSAFADGDGSACPDSPLSDTFLASVMNATASNPLYWPLQEFIYADGELERPIAWAAQRVRDSRPEFAPSHRPLMFTGEAMFPWMFRQEKALQPFRPAMDVLMADTRFDKIYDAEQLKRNEVPLEAGVYFDDMYVDSGMQLDTLSRVGNSHYWVTNEFEHDGLHGDKVFGHLYREALDRGDLADLI
ncbi:alpha/beta hydrolase fold [Bifidobacterium bohemicum]|uniref:Proline iminopeptidase n=1 Tax=Bifidobacterium bohemicum DSM 22767 TaxID=1437606 RepID=A0A086ZK18_9BIFI|nr:alpha/beta fold hydrolase [Bifidobacterium bohemicum]KFI46868.1 Proline iminopeptidase [Bifidobacterium bohemicum DSM 22767]SCB83513.1 alpha/beta hydrolase fold [Bifidobacterium bohemicum]